MPPDKDAKGKEDAGAGKAQDVPKLPSEGNDADTNSGAPPKDVFPVITLRAPFVVVDNAGKPIFRVQDPHAKGTISGAARGIYYYGDAGTTSFRSQTAFAEPSSSSKTTRPIVRPPLAHSIKKRESTSRWTARGKP